MDRLVEKFAMDFARDKLKPQVGGLVDESGFKPGYDLRSQNILIEVKGLGVGKEGDTVTLTEAETKKAEEFKNNYYLLIVAGMPGNPQGYLIRNPHEHGRVEGELVVLPADKWKAFKL